MKLFIALVFAFWGMGIAHALPNSPLTNDPLASVIRENCGTKIESSSAAASRALTTMLSLQHVRHALAQAKNSIKDPIYCVSALALNKNMYQYVQYYFQIDLYSREEKVAAFQFRFLFQNASVQAYHNVQGQPWTGLQPSKNGDILRSLVLGAKFESIENAENTMEPLALAMKSKTFAAFRGKIDFETLSVLQLPTPHSTADEKPVYLVSWLSSPSADPFAGFVLSQGVLVSTDLAGRALISENVLPVSQVLFPLSKMIEETMTSLPVRDEWASALFKMSANKSF